MEGFYNEMLGDIGARSREAQTMADNNRLFAQQIENRRQSVQGVSLNDEASRAAFSSGRISCCAGSFDY